MKITEPVRERLIQLSLYYHGNYAKIKHAIENKTQVPYQKQSETCLVIGDDLYPKALYDLECPPWVLYYRGNLSLLGKPSIAIVGSRQPCAYAIEMTQRLVTHTDDVVVSGFARGIDIIAMRTHGINRCVGVIASGCDISYPIEHRLYQERVGLCLSEYPQGTLPKKWHFPWRNRLIAALGRSVYVMAAKQASGTMHTVDFALACQRPIYVLAHHIMCEQGSGCMALIEQGAILITKEHLEKKE